MLELHLIDGKDSFFGVCFEAPNLPMFRNQSTLLSTCISIFIFDILISS